MREIIFRGKRTDNKQWVEGFFVSQANDTYIFEPSQVNHGIDIGGYLDCCHPVNVIVKWDMCAWMWETLCEDKRYIGFPDAWCHYECEIIGNIHDNPELLKGGAE